MLPAATLVLAIVPYIARIARGALREALGMPYTQAAVLRGLSRRTVIWDHAMRNAGVPLVNAVAINIVYLLSGVIVVEWVFAFPGIGQGLVQATSTSDAFTTSSRPSSSTRRGARPRHGVRSSARQRVESALRSARSSCS